MGRVGLRWVVSESAGGGGCDGSLVSLRGGGDCDGSLVSLGGLRWVVSESAGGLRWVISESAGKVRGTCEREGERK